MLRGLAPEKFTRGTRISKAAGSWKYDNGNIPAFLAGFSGFMRISLGLLP